MRFSAWFFLVTGVLMVGQWGFFLASGSVPEVKTAPISPWHFTWQPNLRKCSKDSLR